ncbi:MAG: hypothetical protein ACOCS6_03645 [Desulfosalsimonas sp.]
MKKELTIFDKPRNVRILLVCFYISLGILLIADFFIHKHAAFGWEAYPSFFAAYGFISCVLFIYAAKLLRRLVKRSEDYYHRKK